MMWVELWIVRNVHFCVWVASLLGIQPISWRKLRLCARLFSLPCFHSRSLALSRSDVGQTASLNKRRSWAAEPCPFLGQVVAESHTAHQDPSPVKFIQKLVSLVFSWTSLTRQVTGTFRHWCLHWFGLLPLFRGFGRHPWDRPVLWSGDVSEKHSMFCRRKGRENY